MSKLPEGIWPIFAKGQRNVFDFGCQIGQVFITDYRHLNEKIIAENSVVVTLGGEQKRIKVTSIDELRGVLGEFMSEAIEILNRYPPFYCEDSFIYLGFDKLKLEPELVKNQLIFDILFDKYKKESELMTRFGYSTYMSKHFAGDKYLHGHAIDEMLKRGMENFHNNIIRSSGLQEQLKILGVNPNEYVKYYTSDMKENSRKRKPKFVWDYLFYNFGLVTTSKQYQRQLTRDSRNYSYEEIIRDLKEYNNFVNKLLLTESKSSKEYFNMSMDYYALESYKRIDFIFKLVETLHKLGISEITQEEFPLAMRFVPCILVPCIQENELHFGFSYKYYRPPFMIEEKMLQKMTEETYKETDEEVFEEIHEKTFEEMLAKRQKDSYRTLSVYKAFLLKYQYVRAKTYELFNYHAEFVPNESGDDYIKKFLEDFYNVLEYHTSTGVWEIIKDIEWKDMDSEKQRKIKEQIQVFLSINKMLFRKYID